MTPTSSDRNTFQQHLRESGLLDTRQLREAAERLGGAPAADQARALVQWGWLTPFQARMLLQGRSRGFILGPYRVLEQVGRGGMGKVYKAVHETMNRPVALKVLSPKLVRTRKAREVFRNEVRTAATLNHPNIVQAYDASERDGRFFLAMEYVAGVTLGALVRRRGPLPVGLACEVVRQAALGLAHAHEKGLVHRDVKPTNLMVSAAPARRGAKVIQVKVLDFGLARLLRRSRGLAEGNEEVGRHPITGTPDFMSPEQARNRDGVDIRSDLYSLGCTFYYLLTGQVPFPGGGMLDKLVRHHSEVPAPPERLRPRVPPAVAAVVMRLLAKDPADRFQTPQELADALAPHASTRSLRRPRKARRRPEPSRAPEPVGAGAITLGPDDTAPHACAPAVVDAEREALSSWVEIRLSQRRQQRLALVLGASAAAGALALVATAALVVGLLLWL
jgi:serine/threonine-protein kinase